MVRIYEMCFLGHISSTGSRVKKFKVTQVTEITDPSLPGLILDQIPVPYLVFKRCAIKDLEIGDYVTATTEDNQTFKNFERCLFPRKKLPETEVFEYVIEEKARIMQQKHLAEFRYSKIRLDRILKRLKDAMISLSPSEREMFALYVFQHLTKK